MRTNQAISYQEFTHEGAPAYPHLTPIQQLRRSVLACLLWESEFYESGESIAQRIKETAAQCDPSDVAALAIEARTKYKLRHAPLLLARELARHPAAKGSIVGITITSVINRADELAEFLSLYWMEGKQPLSKQVKRGLAFAFQKFDEYHLAKYNRNNAVKLRDVLFLCHAKPKNEDQAASWKRLVNDELATPDTWETRLSSGADKKESFTVLLKENKLGYMALLRNLRNMHESGVDDQLVADRLLSGAARSKALPFRFVAAARACPQWEPMIDKAMQEAVKHLDKLTGKTTLLVDISASMECGLSAKSDLSRMDAAASLGVLVNGASEQCDIYTFTNNVAVVPPRHGMALRDAIINNQSHGGTYLGGAIKEVKSKPCDRLIVITDEQSADEVPGYEGNGYIVNVASYKNGVGYGQWTHISGFSEAVIQYIIELERSKE